MERLDYEVRVQRLNSLVAQIGEKYRRGNEKVKPLPVDASCRIMMDSFMQVYEKEEVGADIDIVKNKEKQWWEEGRERNFGSIGEQFELLKTAIFNKYLGDRFIVVRSALYDDYKNGVDNVMVDIKTGNVVCAFDEVGDAAAFKRQKEQRVSARNLEEGGASLKYGIKFEDGKLKPARLQNLPIFCLSLSEEEVKRGISEMEFSSGKKSPVEDEIFRICLTELQAQITTLEGNLPEMISGANTEKAAKLKNLSGHLALFKESILNLEIQ